MNLSTAKAQLGHVPERARSRQFNIGPAVVELVGASLGTVGFAGGGAAALDAIYVAVRDRDWGTVAGSVRRRRVTLHEGGFEAIFDVSHEAEEISFTWRGSIRASASGPDKTMLCFSMEGTAKTDFLANRVGFCLLHPLSLSGHRVEVSTPSGSQVSQFPVVISPHQLFSDLLGMAYEVSPMGHCTIAFNGELFETEDQRNWTDPSYKTYCTPLRLPYPRLYRRGEQVNQEVLVLLRATARLDSPSARRRKRRAVRVSLGTPAGAMLPPIGTEHTTGTTVPDKKELALLRDCHFDHVRVVADLSSPNWPSHVSAGAETAGVLNAQLEIEAVVAGTRELEELLSALKPFGIVGRLLVFDRATSVTTRELAMATRTALGRQSKRVDKVVGGSRANFAELNRADLPLELLDEVAVSFNPQVHAFDNASIMSTLRVQPLVIWNTQRIAGNRPVLAGPVTLRPRFNPVATTPSIISTTGTENSYDPRQLSLFAAAWTFGSIACLSPTCVRALTYHGLLGGSGIAAGQTPLVAQLGLHPQAIYPVYHIFAELARLGSLSGRYLRSVQVSEPDKIAALAGGNDTGLWLALANLKPTSVEVVIDTPSTISGATIKRLDEVAVAAGLYQGERQLAQDEVHKLRKLSLHRYEVVFVELEV